MTSLPLQVVQAASEQENSDPDRSFTIDRVNIRAQLLSNGDMEVEELYTYTFDGTYHETIRTIGEEGHKGIEFFKAYAVGNEFDLNEWPPAKFQQLPALKVTKTTSEDEDLLVYRAALSGENETKSVLYHYRVNQVMKEQENTEHWNWKFFDDRNPSDLNQLYVEVELPRAISWAEGLSYDAYTYGSSDGTLDIKDDRFISYDYPYFPAGEPLDVRISFPIASVIDNDSNYLNKSASSSEASESEDSQVWSWLDNLSFVIIILFIFIMIPLILWRRIGIRIWYLIFPKLYMHFDLFKLHVIYFNNQWNGLAIVTGMLALYNRGIVNLSFEKIFKKQTERELIFTLLDVPSHTLRIDEQYLITWLFKQDNRRAFHMKSIAIPDLDEDDRLFQRKLYRHRVELLYPSAYEWYETVGKAPGFSKLSNYEMNRKIPAFIGYGIALILLTLLCICNGLPAILFFAPALLLGLLSFFVSPILLSIEVVVGMVIEGLFGKNHLYKEVNNWLVGDYSFDLIKRVVAIAFIFNPGWFFFIEPSGTFVMYAIFACVLSGLLFPAYVLKKLANQLKQRLISGKYKHINDPKMLEWLLQASIVLNCGYEFLKTHPQLEEVALQHSEYVLLSNARPIVELIYDVYASIYSFETHNIAEQERDKDSYYSSSDSSSSSYYSSDSSSSSSDSSSSSSSDSSDSGGGGGSSSD